MSRMDVKCPACGEINLELDLVETDGWMECEDCGCCWQVVKPLPSSRTLRAVRNHG